MKEKMEILKQMFLSDWTLTEKILLIADVLLLGVLVGWLTSPFTGGLELFSNNTKDTHHYYSEEENE